jgi:hypothetical protein
MLELIGREISPGVASALGWLMNTTDATEMPASELAKITLTTLTLDQALEHMEELRTALMDVAADGATLVEATAPDERDVIDREAFALLVQPKRRSKR